MGIVEESRHFVIVMISDDAPQLQDADELFDHGFLYRSHQPYQGMLLQKVEGFDMTWLRDLVEPEPPKKIGLSLVTK